MLESYEPKGNNYHHVKVTFARADYFGHVVLTVGGNCKGASILSECLEFWGNCDSEDVDRLESNDCELELYNGNYDEFWFRITLTKPSNGDKMQFDELDCEDLTNMIVSVEFDKVEPQENWV